MTSACQINLNQIQPISKKCCQVKGATHKAIWGFFPPSRKAFLHQECLIQLQMARMIVEQLTHLWPLHTH